MERLFGMYDTDWYTIFDMLPNYVFLKDINHQVLWVNRALADVYKMNVKEACDYVNALSVDINEFQHRYYKNDQEVFDTGKPKINILEQDLFGGWFITHKIPITDKNNKVIGLIGMSQNINELRERNIEFDNIIESSPEIVIIHDFEGNCQKVYTGKISNIWWKDDILVGMNVKDIFNDESIKNLFCQNLIKLKEDENHLPVIFEFSMVRENIEYCYEVILTLYNSDKVMSVTRDISDRKRLDILRGFNNSIVTLMSHNKKLLESLGLLGDEKNGK